jgi:hypothetical protein
VSFVDSSGSAYDRLSFRPGRLPTYRPIVKKLFSVPNDFNSTNMIQPVLLLNILNVRILSEDFRDILKTLI